MNQARKSPNFIITRERLANHYGCVPMCVKCFIFNFTSFVNDTTRHIIFYAAIDPRDQVF